MVTFGKDELLPEFADNRTFYAQNSSPDVVFLGARTPMFYLTVAILVCFRQIIKERQLEKNEKGVLSGPFSGTLQIKGFIYSFS